MSSWRHWTNDHFKDDGSNSRREISAGSTKRVIVLAHLRDMG